MITIPTIAELYTSILNDLESHLGVSTPSFGRVFLRALAAVQAGKIKLYYLAIGNLQKNIFVDSADPEIIGGTLERFGRVKLNRNPFAAVAGQYIVTVTGTIGATLPAGTTFKSDDSSSNPQKIFSLDYSHTMLTASDSINIRAFEAGTDSQLSISDTLSLTAPIANVNKIATVTLELIEPLAAETTDEYRILALQAYQLEPNGGSSSDYRLWSADVQGVSKVYPFAKSGAPNEINLFVEATIADSTDGKGTPSAAMLSDVEDWVEANQDDIDPDSRGRRPLGVFQIHFLPVTIKEIDITIASFTGITQTIKDQIFDAIELALETKRPFVAASDILDNQNDVFDTNNIISIILNTRPGSVFGVITLYINSVSFSTFTFQNGDIPHLRTITYT